MAMLAEPRRKNKYSTDPRGTQWSKDDDKFGQKMLEKMGWAKGKGLGANEDGRAEHVSVTLKSDTRGVGCSKSQVDNWIAHQDDFNSLLASLREVNDSPKELNTNTSDEVSSLEKKSKGAKGRVHYMKFTKGKDLSSKKSEDLDCIFGRRKSKSLPSTPKETSKTNSPNNSDTESDKCESGEVKSDHGVITVKNNLSVSDYFAKKMAEIKAKKQQSLHNSGSDPRLNKKEEHTEHGFRKCQTEPASFAKMLRKDDLENMKDCNSSGSENSNSRKRKKEKKKKKSAKCEISEDNDNDIEQVKFEIGDENGAEVPPKKKKKRISSVNGTVDSDIKIVSDDMNVCTVDKIHQTTEEKQSKKKKKKKNGSENIIDETVIASKKSKKKKKKASKVENIPTGRPDYIKINPEKINSPMLKERKEVGFTGSNLGEVIGYAGGIDLTAIIVSKKKK